MSSDSPIGIFDSGVGGLSVLREIRRVLPFEDLIYYADSGHCPYGGKSAEAIRERATVITETLLAQGAKLIVLACNTATIAAVEHLRATYPVPFVGMEPGVKPAVAATRSGVVGVLATGAALAGEKFHRLLAQHAAGVRVINQPCPGWVELVESGDLHSTTARATVAASIEPLLAQGVDVLVLGCTHYPFLAPLIGEIAGPQVRVLDTGAAVANQVQRVLSRENLLCERQTPGTLQWSGSGDPAELARLRGLLLPET